MADENTELHGASPSRVSQRRRHLGLISCAVVLGLGISCQVYWWLNRAAEPADPKPAVLVPDQISGWNVHDEPLGATENLVSVTKQMLRLDDFVHRSFRRGDLEFTVYIAYWRRNSVPVRIVDQHTPDICWSQLGWHCEGAEPKPGILPGNFPSAYYRTFTRGEGSPPIYVLYWHLVGGRVREFQAKENYWRWWLSALDRAKEGSPSQFFVRVSFNRPLEEMMREADFRKTLDRLKILGGTG